MEKTLTVKGTSKLTASPDYIVLRIETVSENPSYQQTIDIAKSKQEALTAAIEKAGFSRTDLKTASFNVNTAYDNQHDASGYRRVFKGFTCNHSFKLEFDLDMQKLSKLLPLIAESTAVPTFSVSFTVKDTEPLKQQLLAAAVNNAKTAAKILAAAANVKLAEIVSIDYNQTQNKFVSSTEYNSVEPMQLRLAKSIEFTPQDIDEQDSVVVVWKIET